MKRALLGLIVFAGLLGAQPAPGQGPGQGQMGIQHRAPKMEALKQSIGLTDAQIEELQALRRGLREELKPVIQEMRETGKQLREAVSSPDVTDAQIGQLVRKMNQLRTQIREAHEAKHAAAVQLMNSWGLGDKLEQLEQAAKLAPAVREARILGLLEGRAGHRAKRKGHKGGPGAPGGAGAPGAAGPMFGGWHTTK